MNQLSVCECVREKEWTRESSTERGRHEVVWLERQPRQDVSVLVNHSRDIYYLMAGSPLKASGSLGSLLQKETLALQIPSDKKH